MGVKQLQAAVCYAVSMHHVQPKSAACRATDLQVHCGGRTEKQPNGISHSLAVGDIFMDGMCGRLLLLLARLGVMKSDGHGGGCGVGGGILDP